MDIVESQGNLSRFGEKIEDPRQFEVLSEFYMWKNRSIFGGLPVLKIRSQSAFYADITGASPISGIDTDRIPSSDRGVDHVIHHGGNRVSLSQTKAYRKGKNVGQDPAKLLIADKVRYEEAGFDVVNLILFSTFSSVSKNCMEVIGEDKNFIVVDHTGMVHVGIPEHFDQIVRYNRDAANPLSESGDPFFLNYDRFTPYKNQIDAKEAIDAEWLTGKKECSVVMACGTGKGFLAVMIVEDRIKNGGFAVVGVPTRSLGAQLGAELKSQLGVQSIIAYVNHDTKIATSESDISSDELRSQVGGAPVFSRNDGEGISLLERTIRERNAEIRKREGIPISLVFVVVYDSSAGISDAQKLYGMPQAEVAIGDEAHRLVSSSEVGRTGGRNSFVWDILAKRRLYMTATPVASPGTVTRIGEPVLGDGAVFGRVVFEYTYTQAVSHERLTDISFVLLLTKLPVAQTGQGGRRIFPVEGVVGDDGKKLLVSEAAYYSIEAVKKITAKPMDAKVSIVFVSSIQEAEEVATAIQKKTGIRAEAVHSKMPTKEIRRRIRYAGTDEAKRRGYVMVSVRLLTEGIDIPKLDAVIYAHPISSEVVAMQSAMRPGRTHRDKKKAYIVFPCAMQDVAVEGRTTEESLESIRSFYPRYEALVKCALSLLGGESIQAILERVSVASTEGDTFAGESEAPAKLPIDPDSDVVKKIRAKLINDLYLHVTPSIVGGIDIVQRITARAAQILNIDPREIAVLIAEKRMSEEQKDAMREAVLIEKMATEAAMALV